MDNFIFHIPTRVYFGRGEICNLGEALKDAGAKRVLFVYGEGSIKRTGIYDMVIALLEDNDIFYVELPGIKPNPRVESVIEGAKLCRENDIELVLAVGGGSTADASKAIAAAATYNGDVMDLLKQRVEVKNPLKIGIVMTFAGTGSEMDCGGVITAGEANKKHIIMHKSLFPVFSILDPEYTFSVSREQTAAGIADILSHLMEQYFHPATGTDVQDGMNEGIMKALIKHGSIVVKEPENYESRAVVLWASSMALAGFQFQLGKKSFRYPVHIMGHELSSRYDMTHGVSLALLTPAWMKHTLENASKYIPLFARFARNVFGIDRVEDIRAAHMGIDELVKFYKQLGLPSSLQEVGVLADDLKFLADKATELGPVGILSKIDKAEAYDIYKRSYLPVMDKTDSFSVK